MVAYCGDEFGQALGFVPGVCLLFEALDAVGVGVCGVGFVQGSFPVLPCRLLGLFVCVSALFRGFAAEVDFLRDFGELVFQGRSGRSVHSLPRCGVPPRRVKRSLWGHRGDVCLGLRGAPALHVR
ncbi:hypothetical protein [Streptomyces sp. NPDC102462]|uniref:hypothetical protein n=1 Tax=Streptomyces sp. NPDC102462 TaxID=3366178 RepID=UPI0037F7A030